MERKILERRPGSTIEAFGQRGMWVPDGLTAGEIVAGGRELWERLEVSRGYAELLATAVLEAAMRARLFSCALEAGKEVQ